jgi:hypothetical protein
MANQVFPTGGDSRFGELLHHITDDVKTIARGELELARNEVTRTSRAAAADAAVIVIGAVVALIGLGLLCVAAVVALAPVIPQLWLRLLIFAAIYLVIGGVLAAVFAKRLPRDATPDLHEAKEEARLTAQDVADGLRH